MHPSVPHAGSGYDLIACFAQVSFCFRLQSHHSQLFRSAAAPIFFQGLQFLPGPTRLGFFFRRCSKNRFIVYFNLSLHEGVAFFITDVLAIVSCASLKFILHFVLTGSAEVDALSLFFQLESSQVGEFHARETC